MKKILPFVAIFLLSVEVCGFASSRRLAFYWQHLKQPLQVGSITPSSSATGNCITKYISEDSGSKNILEIGAGPGSGITDKLVSDLSEKDHLTIVEINEEFVKILKKKYGNLANVSIVEADILEYAPEKKFDYIVSTLPLTVFPINFIKQYYEVLERMIQPEGIISYIQYIGFPNLRVLVDKILGRKDFIEKISLIENFKKKWSLGSQKILLNVPPTWVHHLRVS